MTQVDAGDSVHCEWKVRMQIALQGIVQLFKFLRATTDLRHVAIERDCTQDPQDESEI